MDTVQSSGAIVCVDILLSTFVSVHIYPAKMPPPDQKRGGLSSLLRSKAPSG